MGVNKLWLLAVFLAAAAVSAAGQDSSPVKATVVKTKGKKRYCVNGWECPNPSVHCCNQTISQYFQAYQFENLFSKRNSPVAHANSFWDYRSFILASTLFQPLGFGTTGTKEESMIEVAAFLAHVGSQTSCGYSVATGGPNAWGLCYNKELSPDQIYCDNSYAQYPCAPGAAYYGRGAIPLYWSYNYGMMGDYLKLDLLNHPEYVEQNATIAFMTAMQKWMLPVRRNQPSPHQAMLGLWKVTKNDTLSKRYAGFGTTMNVLYGDRTCGKGDLEAMDTIISHYTYYLDLMGIGREKAGNTTCAEQIVYNPSSTQSSS